VRPLRPILCACTLAACAHAPEAEPTRVDSDWVQPRLDEAARGALACVRDEPDRVLEIELPPEGHARAWVYPYPAAPAQQACADRFASGVPLQPANDVVRSVVRGDGQQLDARGPRARALGLRARAIDQLDGVERCRREWQRRAPGQSARIGVTVTLGDRAVDAAEATASTADASTTACVLAAVRGLRVAGMRGTYRYSYLLGPRGAAVGAPDLDPVDAHALSSAVAGQRAAINGCVSGYRSAGRLALRVRFGNSGVPLGTTIDRDSNVGEQDESDLRADACLRRVGAALRVPPFDGPPSDQAIPFSLR